MNRIELRIKIFKRACKESECFSYKQWMREIIDRIKEGDEIFFGEYEPKPEPHPSPKYQFKCQLLFLKMSAEKNVLTKQGTVRALSDTFKRYDCNCLRDKSGTAFSFWTEVNNYSDKDNIKNEILNYSNKKGFIVKEQHFYMPAYTVESVLQPPQ